MEKDELKYNELIGKLRSNEPILDNPEELTEKIMWSLNKKDSKITKVIILARPWLSAAAIFLVALFIYQNNDAPVEEVKTIPVATNREKPEHDCLAGLKTGKINRRTLLQSYQCYQKRLEQDRSTKDLIIKYQDKF